MIIQSNIFFSINKTSYLEVLYDIVADTNNKNDYCKLPIFSSNLHNTSLPGNLTFLFE
jgi:hypothetical protein